MMLEKNVTLKTNSGPLSSNLHTQIQKGGQMVTSQPCQYLTTCNGFHLPELEESQTKEKVALPQMSLFLFNVFEQDVSNGILYIAITNISKDEEM